MQFHFIFKIKIKRAHCIQASTRFICSICMARVMVISSKADTTTTRSLRLRLQGNAMQTQSNSSRKLSELAMPSGRRYRVVLFAQQGASAK